MKVPKKLVGVWAVVILFTAVFISGCKGEDEPKPTLSVNPAGNVTFSGDGSTMTVNGNEAPPTFIVTCQGAWTATSDSRWAKVDPKGSSFTISVEKNGGEQARGPAVVTISAQGVDPVQIRISQEALPVDEQYGRAADILGRGYDITGMYADSSSPKEAVLSFPLLAEANMVKRDLNYRNADFTETYGNTSQEFSASLARQASIGASLDVKGIVAFQTELSSRYSKNEYGSDAYAFAVIRSRIKNDAYYLDKRSDPRKLSQYISEQFKRDLRVLSPSQLIAKYGTHVMLGGVWGARLDHHFSEKKTASGYDQSASKAFEARARASYFGITAGASAGASQTTGSSEASASTSGKKQTILHGGDPQFGQLIMQNLNYEAWVASINDKNIVWMDYYPESLQPIYLFAQTDAQREALEKGYNEYLEAKGISVTGSLQDKQVTGTFSVKGAKLISDGKVDKAVHTVDNGKTEWSLIINLEKGAEGSKSTIVPHITYRVREMQRDQTTFEITNRASLSTPVEKDFIFLSDTYCSSGQQIYKGKKHGFFKPSLSDSTKKELEKCIDLKSLEIAIDSPDSNDSAHIGVRGTWKATIGFVE